MISIYNHRVMRDGLCQEKTFFFVTFWLVKNVRDGKIVSYHGAKKESFDAGQDNESLALFAKKYGYTTEKEAKKRIDAWIKYLSLLNIPIGTLEPACIHIQMRKDEAIRLGFLSD